MIQAVKNIKTIAFTITSGLVRSSPCLNMQEFSSVIDTNCIYSIDELPIQVNVAYFVDIAKTVIPNVFARRVCRVVLLSVQFQY